MARVKGLTPSHRLIHISVHRGNADIAGLADSAAEREAILVAAENTPGIRSIQDRMVRAPDRFLSQGESPMTRLRAPLIAAILFGGVCLVLGTLGTMPIESRTVLSRP